MEYFEKILESIEDPLIVVSKEGDIIYANQAGHFLKSQIGKSNLTQLFSELLSMEAIKTGRSVKGIFKEINNSKFLIDVFPFEDKGITLLVRDITRFVELEEVARKEGLIITISKLLSSIFHDMKGPVGGIKGAAQLLKEDINDKELVEDILYEVKRIESLINEITNITKPVPLRKREINIHKVIDEAIKSLEKQYSEVKFERLYDPSIPDLFVDPDYMLRVFINIIKNGIEATQQKGIIRISTGISWDKVYSPAGNKIFIRIKDSGPGVPEDMIDKLFLPFVSTKKTGMGIGLSSSYKIVKDHGGVLRYIGDSTFEILLPISDRGKK